jgi:hypothetical protein
MAGAALSVPRFVVIGGGADGALYVRQLLRAVTAGRLRTDALHVVDRDPACAVSRSPHPLVRLQRADWNDWLDEHLDGFGVGDHFVPYHWAPHLLVEWLERQARRVGAFTRRDPAVPPAGVPFERPTRDGALALSYATWPCPPTCIEPALCPHTRAAKHWSLAADLDAPGVLEPLVFRCLHLVHGVATIPVASLLAARRCVLAGLARGPRRYRVATASHCHGLASVLEVVPPSPARPPGPSPN